MAKNKYRDVALRLDEVEQWSKDGLIDSEIARRLGIAESTFYVYKENHTEFSESLKRGKDYADCEVEQSLYKKALGFKEIVKKPIKTKTVLYDNGKRVKEEETIIMAEEEIFIPPDTTAQIFWLKNRQSVKWRDKQEIQVDGNITVNFNIPRPKKD